MSFGPIPLLPTFLYACDYNPSFLGLLTRHLTNLGIKIPSSQNGGSFRRYTGDTSVMGRGEILLWDGHK